MILLTEYVEIIMVCTFAYIAYTITIQCDAKGTVICITKRMA